MHAPLDLSGWSQVPLDELLDHLVETYVRPLVETMERVARALRSAHAPAAPREVLDELRDLIVEHVRREEDLVFPWLRTNNRASAGMLVAMLEREHGKMTRSAETLRALLPASVLGQPAVDRSLEELDRLLAGHIRLENDVLFPRALASSGEHP